MATTMNDFVGSQESAIATGFCSAQKKGRDATSFGELSDLNSRRSAAGHDCSFAESSLARMPTSVSLLSTRRTAW